MEEDLLARDTGFTFPQPTVVTCAIFRTSRNLSINTTGTTVLQTRTSSPTTTETRSSPSSSRQFRLPGAPCWTPTASLLLRTASTSPTPPRYHRSRVLARTQASKDVDRRIRAWLPSPVWGDKSQHFVRRPSPPGRISRSARPFSLESRGRSTHRLAHSASLALAESEPRRALAVTDRTRQRAASPPFALADTCRARSRATTLR